MTAGRRAMAAAVLLLAAAGSACGGGSAPDSGGNGAGRPAPSDLAMNTGPAPWPAPTGAAARISAAGLPQLEVEGVRVHFHAHLDVFVDGRPVPVPGSIGIDVDRRVLSPLHTHTTDGILHVESDDPVEVTMRQVFIEWGVRLTSTCVGGYCRPHTPIRLVVNGVDVDGPIGDLTLADRQEIALVVGTPPLTVPSQFPD